MFEKFHNITTYASILIPVISLKISDEIWEEKDKELLEDLVVAAVNEGLNKSREMMQEEMEKVTGFGGGQMPFGL